MNGIVRDPEKIYPWFSSHDNYPDTEGFCWKTKIQADQIFQPRSV